MATKQDHVWFGVHEYVALPGDKKMYYAGDPEATGIMCAGRETYELAEQDSKALNAAVARQALRGKEDMARQLECEARERGLSMHRIHTLVSAMVACIGPMERCGLLSLADMARRAIEGKSP